TARRDSPARARSVRARGRTRQIFRQQRRIWWRDRHSDYVRVTTGRTPTKQREIRFRHDPLEKNQEERTASTQASGDSQAKPGASQAVRCSPLRLSYAAHRNERSEASARTKLVAGLIVV